MYSNTIFSLPLIVYMCISHIIAIQVRQCKVLTCMQGPAERSSAVHQLHPYLSQLMSPQGISTENHVQEQYSPHVNLYNMHVLYIYIYIYQYNTHICISIGCIYVHTRI